MITLVLKNNNSQSGLMTILFGQAVSGFVSDNPVDSSKVYKAGTTVIIRDDALFAARIKKDANTQSIITEANRAGRLQGISGTAVGRALVEVMGTTNQTGTGVGSANSANVGGIEKFLNDYSTELAIAGLAMGAYIVMGGKP